jgi:hypothetical protein
MTINVASFHVLQLQVVKEIMNNFSYRLKNTEELLEKVTNQQIAINRSRIRYILILGSSFRTYAQ